MQDLLASRFTGYFAAPPTALPHVETGKLTPLATTGLPRPAYLPNITTVAEAAFPGFEALNWYAFVASAKTPAPILDRWNLEVVKVLKDPEVRDALTRHGLTPHPTTRAELTEFMTRESAKWGAIVREARSPQSKDRKDIVRARGQTLSPSDSMELHGEEPPFSFISFAPLAQPPAGWPDS